MSITPDLGDFPDLPAPKDLADVIERLMSVMYWLDAKGYQRAAIDVNGALENLLSEPH